MTACLGSFARQLQTAAKLPISKIIEATTTKLMGRESALIDQKAKSPSINSPVNMGNKY